MRLRAAGAHEVLLAGRAGGRADELNTAGVTGYIYLGMDVPALLLRLLSAAGDTR